MGEKEREQGKREKSEGRELATWEPFSELAEWPFAWERGLLSRRFERLLEEMFGARPALAARGALMPAIDLTENDTQYTLAVELPGVGKDDVHLEVEEGVLTVRGEKRSEREEKKERRRYVERSYGAFSRSLRLPRDADAEHLEATFKDGVLTIKMPRTQAAKPRQIAIKSA